jgi:hypothetical protein
MYVDDLCAWKADVASTLGVSLTPHAPLPALPHAPTHYASLSDTVQHTELSLHCSRYTTYAQFRRQHTLQENRAIKFRAEDWLRRLTLLSRIEPIYNQLAVTLESRECVNRVWMGASTLYAGKLSEEKAAHGDTDMKKNMLEKELLDTQVCIAHMRMYLCTKIHTHVK